MDLLQLRYFCTVVETKNISQAARLHNIPQPAMSKMISRLENELDTVLFDRTRNHTTPTEKGMQFYSYVKKGLVSINDGVKSISAENKENSIHLLLNSNRSIALKFIADFKKKNPGVNFIIDHNNSMETIQHQHIYSPHHLCISEIPVAADYDRCIPLIKERIMLAVNIMHPFVRRESVTLEDISREEFLIIAPKYITHTLFTEYCQRLGIPLNISMYCGETAYVRESVDNGLGVSFMPELTWNNLIGSKTKLIPIDELPLYLSHNIYWDSSRYLPPIVIKFRDELIAYYKKHYPSDRG